MKDSLTITTGLYYMKFYVYLEKELWLLTHSHISEMLNITVSESKYFYKRARYIISYPERMWTEGLSNRASNAVLKRYKDLKQLIHDLEVESTDLSKLEGVGDIIADEIQRWVHKNKATN